MPRIRDLSFDAALNDIRNNAVRLDICHTAEPTTYAQATGANSCGNETGLTVGAPTDNAPDGRKVVVPAITAGDVTATETAAFWALTDGASILYATGALTATQAVTSGNTFSLDAIDIAIRDATTAA